MNKEQAYDAKIAPLITQIVGICREHGIAMVSSFAIPNDDDPNLRCSTHLADGDGAKPFEDAVRVIMGSRPPPMMITTRDANGEVSRMTAVIG